MMEDFNFNDPLEVTEVFRTVSTKLLLSEAREEDEREEWERDPEEEKKPQKPELKEFAFKHSMVWEDVRSVKEYMYPDDWKEHRGPKFWMKLDSQQDEIIVLGNYKSMTEHWREFRNRYPLFVDRKDGGSKV